MYHPDFRTMRVQDHPVILLQCKHRGSDILAFDAKVICKSVTGGCTTMLHEMMHDDVVE
jgi:hypothetical protein